MISIHAPRTGSDGKELMDRVTSGISIHAPRTGSDYSAIITERWTLYFNPRSPHGERLVASKAGCTIRISIHAPRTGSDL